MSYNLVWTDNMVRNLVNDDVYVWHSKNYNCVYCRVKMSFDGICNEWVMIYRLCHGWMVVIITCEMQLYEYIMCYDVCDIFHLKVKYVRNVRIVMSIGFMTIDKIKMNVNMNYDETYAYCIMGGMWGKSVWVENMLHALRLEGVQNLRGGHSVYMHICESWEIEKNLENGPQIHGKEIKV